MTASPPTAVGSRLTREDLRALYLHEPIHSLGRRAWEVCEHLHPEDYRTYVVDRNINYANWCTARCIFCNFKADPPDKPSGRRGLPAGYTLTHEQIGRKIEELLAIGGTQILMHGGLVPALGMVGLPFELYLDLMRFIRRNYPTVHVHAFSPPEIFAFHQVYGTPVAEVLARLQEAGLESVPGGGAEILSDRVRRKIGQGKTTAGEWLDVMRQCHILGMRTSCTMMFGHVETLDERLEHLLLLRELQDESLARANGGGFGAFICWPFQPAGTPLGRVRPLPLEKSKVESRNAETPKRAPRSVGPPWPTGTPAASTGAMDAGARPEEAAGERTAGARTAGARTAGARIPSRTHSEGNPFPPPPEGIPAESGNEKGFSFQQADAPPQSAVRNPQSAIESPTFAGGSRPLNDGNHLLLADAHEYLTMLALARLALDNIPNIQSSWVTMGPKIGQLALFFGANDMGSVMMEENVVSAAGTTYRLNEPEIRRLITDAGWRPQKRDYYYRAVE